MKKSMISKEGLKDRTLFLQHFATAGWDVDGWDALFDADSDIAPEAEAHYRGPIFDLQTEYYAKQRHILFAIMQDEGDLVLQLQLHLSNQIQPLLDTITTAQDTLNEENLADLVKALIPHCTRIIVQTDDGEYELSF